MLELTFEQVEVRVNRLCKEMRAAISVSINQVIPQALFKCKRI